VRRRQFILAGAAVPLSLAFDRLHAAMGPETVFDDETVPRLARALAGRAYAPADRNLPKWLADIGYDQYRDLRFRAGAALWRNDGLPFQAQFFHRGFLFKERIDIHVVENGRATPVAYRPDMFDHGKLAVSKDPALGFAGFRLHAHVNNAQVFDELCVFLGASYFRAVARGLAYGLSARGLALGSGDPGPEEFPLFKAFWLEKPAPGADRVVVHALLDSPSVAGAYRFVVIPAGAETAIETDARLYPRIELRNAGVAALTSMFEFDAGDRVGVDDFRPAVHDSDGLAILNGAGEQVWRPLNNPKGIEHSGFQDDNPRGFGLMQRARGFSDYQDAEANYEKRPSAWVEPLGDWGAGEVHLVELPTADEYHDNIVAFWRPREPLAAAREHRWRYRLHWCADHAWLPDLARVAATRAGDQHGARLYVIDLDGGRLDAMAANALPKVDAAASAGELRNPVVYRVEQAGVWRMSFEFAPGDAKVAELRARAVDAQGQPLSETWLSRWIA
jgi:glucans biosynthesis protein